MSSRNDRAWATYDSWLLKGSGVDDNTPEVFESSEFKMFSCNEENIASFDDLIAKAKIDPSIYLSMEDGDIYDLEGYKYYLLDDQICGVLHKDSYDAIEEFWDNYTSEKEAYADYKADQERD